MIRDTKNHKNSPMVTSDRWHVLRARWTGDTSGEPLYRRTIVSEHDDSTAATHAARQIAAAFAAEMVGRTSETRDQVLVRRPGYKSLEVAKRAGTRRK